MKEGNILVFQVMKVNIGLRRINHNIISQKIMNFKIRVRNMNNKRGSFHGSKEAHFRDSQVVNHQALDFPGNLNPEINSQDKRLHLEVADNLLVHRILHHLHLLQQKNNFKLLQLIQGPFVAVCFVSHMFGLTETNFGSFQLLSAETQWLDFGGEEIGGY